jgi:hypothetical protein
LATWHNCAGKDELHAPLGHTRGADSRIIEATADMYGDLQCIAGEAPKEIDGVALPLIEEKGGTI